MCNAPTGLVDLSLASKVSGGSRPSDAPSSQPSASLEALFPSKPLEPSSQPPGPADTII